MNKRQAAGSADLRPPIILFGNARSGTTIIQNLIGEHPEVVSWYEPRTMWQYADPGREHDEFEADDASPPVKRYIRHRFLDYQRRHGGRIVFEKTPVNVMRIPYVREILPEATFLYIVRSPLSYVSSMELKWQRPVTVKGLGWRIRSTPNLQLHHYIRKFVRQQVDKRVLRRKYLSVWGPRYRGISDDLTDLDVMTVIARQWARASAKADRDLAQFGAGRVLRLRYEDFVAEPVSTVRRICRHADLDINARVLEMAGQVVKSDRQNKWERFDPDDLARIVPELRDEMLRHGYELPAELAATHVTGADRGQGPSMA